MGFPLIPVTYVGRLVLDVILRNTFNCGVRKFLTQIPYIAYQDLEWNFSILGYCKQIQWFLYESGLSHFLVLLKQEIVWREVS